MYDSRRVIGKFFEHKVIQLFDLAIADSEDSGRVPDLVSRDGSFYVEVKSSAYNNGGVINENQLNRFNKKIQAKTSRRFYAFVYHPIAKNIQEQFPTEQELSEALSIRSLYLFPFSIVRAYFSHNPKIKTPKHQSFVQLRENQAQRIFAGDEDIWQCLRLNPKHYRPLNLHDKVKIMTRNGHLEQQILDSFHPEFI
jgi:hypothetical protein